MPKPKYIHYPKRPKNMTATFVAQQYKKLTDQLQNAEASKTPNMWLKLFEEWNELNAYIGSEAARIGYASSKDLSDKTLEAKEKYIREKISPVIAKPEHLLAEAFLASKHREAIAKKYGEQLIPVYEIALKPMNPINTKLGIKAGSLTSKYDKIIAAGNVTINGKKTNLWSARALLFSDDDKLRKEAFLATSNWFIKNHDKLASLYDQLVKLRHQMGLNLNYDNYIPLAYQMRGRQGYSQKEVKAFRALVLKHISPLVSKNLEKRAKELGQDSLKPWDIFYDPKTSIQLGSVPVKTQLDKASKIFNNISPILGKHFNDMRKDNLIDLETRPNKKSGAFCTDFCDEGKVAILCNSTGDADDVRTLTHEMGHAFQGLESMHIEAVDLQWGSFELAEVYSMGMEFLSLPYMSEFFDKVNEDKFVRFKWVDSAFTTCYVCVVDEFQHWVYENPEASAIDRDKFWAKTYQKYLPAVDYSGYEQYEATRWYAQGHIFNAPFYYIDYGLAEICAMQFGIMNEIDHKKAVSLYLKMCKLGGTRSFIDTLKYCGLSSPFDETTIKNTAEYLKRFLV